MTDMTIWRSIATVFVTIAFIAICWWAFSPKRKKRFDEAANLPFADEQLKPSPSQSFDKSPKKGRGESGFQRN